MQVQQFIDDKQLPYVKEWLIFELGKSKEPCDKNHCHKAFLDELNQFG